MLHVNGRFTGMFWVGAIVCFGLWVLYGVYLAKRSADIRRKMIAISSKRRLILGAGLLVGSLVFLVGLLGAMFLGRSDEAGIPLWLWPIIALIGLGFVHAQTFATAMLVTMTQESVTRSRSESSTVEGHESNESSSKARF